METLTQDAFFVTAAVFTGVGSIGLGVARRFMHRNPDLHIKIAVVSVIVLVISMTAAFYKSIWFAILLYLVVGFAGYNAWRRYRRAFSG